MIALKVGVVGSRNFTDERLMTGAVEDLFCIADPTVFISGGAHGADDMIARIALSMGIDIIEHVPNRARYNWPAAAFERNTLIVNDSDMLLAFFGPGQPPSVNKSGTMDTVRKAIAKRIPVHLYFQDEA